MTVPSAQPVGAPAQSLPLVSPDLGGGASPRRAMSGVLTALIEGIVSGRWPPGTLLPAEEHLLAESGVSRPTLRESLQHMVAAGLIRSRPRAGTVVLPQSRWNLLDPMVLDAALRHIRDRAFYDSLLDARMVMEPEIAAQVARTGTPRALAAIGVAFADMVDAPDRMSESWNRADLAFHTAIIEASGNWVFRHFIVAIRAALLASFGLTNRLSQSHGDTLAMHRAVNDAIQRHDPDGARSAMQALIVLARQDMDAALR